MYRGTTPTLTFALPFQAGVIKNLFVTFSQKGQILLEKTTADCGLIGNTIELNLTQEDTLKFMPGNAELQVRIIDNSNQALASKIYSINIGSILKDGIIE